MLVPMEDLKEDDMSRLEKMKQLPKQLKFILQTDKKYKVEAGRKVRGFFSKIRTQNLNINTNRKHVKRTLYAQYVLSTFIS